jgi:hypothetical protein
MENQSSNFKYFARFGPEFGNLQQAHDFVKELKKKAPKTNDLVYITFQERDPRPPLRFRFWVPMWLRNLLTYEH